MNEIRMEIAKVIAKVINENYTEEEIENMKKEWKKLK